MKLEDLTDTGKRALSEARRYYTSILIKAIVRGRGNWIVEGSYLDGWEGIDSIKTFPIVVDNLSGCERTLLISHVQLFVSYCHLMPVFWCDETDTVLPFIPFHPQTPEPDSSFVGAADDWVCPLDIEPLHRVMSFNDLLENHNGETSYSLPIVGKNYFLHTSVEENGPRWISKFQFFSDVWSWRGFTVDDHSSLIPVSLDNNDLHFQSDDGKTHLQPMIDSFKFVPRLKHLNLKGSSIGGVEEWRALGDALKFIPQLQNLDLQNCSIDEEGCQVLGRSLKFIPHLQHLDLQGCSIDEEGLGSLAGSFKWIPQLQVLNLGSNYLGDKGCQTLCQSMKFIPRLLHLYLQDCSIGDEGCKFLGKAFKHVGRLQCLNLWENRVDEEGLQCLGSSLHLLPELKQFSTGTWKWNEGHGELSTSEVWEPVFKFIIPRMKHLQKLDISRCSIEEEGCQVLAEVFKQIPGLQHLNLLDKTIDDDGVRILADALKHVPGLKHLNLQGCSVGEDGCQYLSKALNYIPDLQGLNLQGCSIGDEGCRSLSQALKHIPRLRHLDLQGCSIGDEGCRFLKQSLKHTPDLRELNLGDCSIGEDGFRYLVEALKHVPLLQELNLQGCLIEEKGYQVLGQSLKFVPELKYLAFSSYTWDRTNLTFSHNDDDSSEDEWLMLCRFVLPGLKNLRKIHMRKACLEEKCLMALVEILSCLPDLEEFVFGPFTWKASEAKFTVSTMDCDDEWRLACEIILPQLKNLQKIVIPKCLIGDDGCEFLSGALRHVPGLQSLDLRNNEIEDDGCKFLSKALVHVPGLQSLDLRNNDVSETGCRVLFQSLRHVPQLQYLALESFLWDEAAGEFSLSRSVEMEPLCDFISNKANSLRKVTMSNCLFGDDGCQHLARVLSQAPGLFHLDLENNDLGEESGQLLVEALRCLPELETLNLGSNHFGAKVCRFLTETLKNLPKLKHFNLMDDEIEDTCCRTLGNSMKFVPDLQDFAFGSYTWDGPRGTFSAPVLSSEDEWLMICKFVLPKLKGLRKLYVPNCQLGEDGCRLFSSFTTLEYLFFGPFIWDGGNGCITTTSVIPQCGWGVIGHAFFLNLSNIRKISLPNLAMGDEGCRALSSCLNLFPQLEHLDIQANEISDDGCRILAEALRRAPVLTYINLGNNDIGDEGCGGLSETFRHTPLLQTLIIWRNRFGDVGCRDLVEALRHTPQLKHLDLGNNNIEARGCDLIGRSLEFLSHLQFLRLFCFTWDKHEDEFTFYSLHSKNQWRSVCEFVLPKLPTVGRIYMMDCRIVDGDCSLLVEALKNLPRVYHLDLQGNNEISDESCQIISKTLNTDSSPSRLTWTITRSPDNSTLKPESGAVGSQDCRKTLSGHSEPVTSVAFSPDGQTLASGSWDETIKLWNPVSGECVKTFTGHTKAAQSVVISPDGKILASGSEDNTVKLWNLESGECLKTLSGHSNSVNSVVFSPDGKIVASGSGDATIKLWNPVTGKCLKTLTGHSRWVKSVAFSPDGQTVASGSDDETVKLWNPVTGDCIKTLTGHLYSVNAVAFSPDGQILASGSNDKSIKLWNLDSGECLKTLADHSKCVYSIAFSPDGQTLASGSNDNSVKLWDLVTGQCRKTLTGHSGNVYTVAFSPDGKIVASGSDDESIKTWNPGSREASESLKQRELVSGRIAKTLTGHTEAVNAVAFSPDGQTLASGSRDNTVRLWR